MAPQLNKDVPALLTACSGRLACRSAAAALVLFIFTAGLARPDTLWNRTDEAGMKQGWWKKEYPNGELMYRGFFRDNRPEGIMKRYYEDGKLKAVLQHLDGGNITYAEMYFRNGKMAARGKYNRQQRDSIWTYWSYYTGTLSLRESYKMGQKEGPTVKYYPGGAEAEVMHWKNNLRHGTWEQFYEDSTMRLSSAHHLGEINGPYRIYGRNRKIILEGSYVNGKQDGKWKFYNGEGKMEKTIRFDMGTLVDREEYEEWMQQFMDEMERNMGKIPEPDLDNFFDRQ